MPRLKRGSHAQRAREANEARRMARGVKKECVEGSEIAIESGKVGITVGTKINAGAAGTERRGVVHGERAEEVVMNMSTTVKLLCDRLKNIAPNSPHPPALPSNNSMPDVIAQHLQLVQAIIGSELGEASLRDLLDPVVRLDAQTMHVYSEALAATSAIGVVVVQPYIWMLRLANAESTAPYMDVRHYVFNYVDD
ncbi:unnamed protein product [Toxocara canis]|uniref:Uncharacterized protein n=1 Tax=Toxocara canis TaxID=6265 RepID=A0A183UVM6_TOXCA|nr:unnamed protein product [Toxocara canis]